MKGGQKQRVGKKCTKVKKMNEFIIITTNISNTHFRDLILLV